MEANVVEGADSPLDVDEAVPCGSLEAWEIWNVEPYWNEFRT